MEHKYTCTRVEHTMTAWEISRVLEYSSAVETRSAPGSLSRPRANVPIVSPSSPKYGTARGRTAHKRGS